MTLEHPDYRVPPTEADRLAVLEKVVAALRPLADELPDLRRQVAELRVAQPRAWNDTDHLAARIVPRRSAKWWREACRLRLVPEARKHPDSGRWEVSAAGVERLERDGPPVMPREARTAG